MSSQLGMYDVIPNKMIQGLNLANLAAQQQLWGSETFFFCSATFYRWACPHGQLPQCAKWLHRSRYCIQTENKGLSFPCGLLKCEKSFSEQLFQSPQQISSRICFAYRTCPCWNNQQGKWIAAVFRIRCELSDRSSSLEGHLNRTEVLSAKNTRKPSG